MLRPFVLASLMLVACTQDFDVFTPDGGAGEAASDATANDSAPPSDATTDTTPPGDAGPLMFTCGTSSTVSDCSQCAGQPEPCVFCNQTTPSMLSGRCVAANASCFGGAPNGYNFCACGGNSPSGCPDPYQVCRQGSCRTCTESTNDNGLMCKGGGTCAYDAGCQ